MTSPPARYSNCIGWALGDTNNFWDPGMIGVRGYYWPPGVPREDSLSSWIQVFERHGYRICDSAEFEPGLEKVAIYADPSNVPTHVARQKSSGAWTSKVGKGEDIEHDDLAGLEGDFFGTVVRILKRTCHGEGVTVG